MDIKHYCEYLEKVRTRTTPSRTKMSEHWPEFHPNTIRSYEKENRLASIDYLAALSLETGEPFENLIKLRLKAAKLISDEQIEALFPDQTLINIDSLNKPEQRNTFKVNDDSMQPALKRGSIATYIAEFDGVIQGDMYAVLLNNELAVRRIQYDSSGDLILVCDNPTFINTMVEKAKKDEVVVGKISQVLNNY